MNNREMSVKECGKQCREEGDDKVFGEPERC